MQAVLLLSSGLQIQEMPVFNLPLWQAGKRDLSAQASLQRQVFHSGGGGTSE
jgi:hypothetical protein